VRTKFDIYGSIPLLVDYKFPRVSSAQGIITLAGLGYLI